MRVPGGMLSRAQDNHDLWWIALFPGAARMVAVFCYNLLGDGLRDIVDPGEWLLLGVDLVKPVDRTKAAEQLRALRGRTHELHSALALVRDREALFTCVDTARLTMRDFSDRFLDDYLDMAGDAAMNSVGGYQLEGIGIHLFERIEGDHFTILGLPLLELLAELRKQRVIEE